MRGCSEAIATGAPRLPLDTWLEQDWPGRIAFRLTSAAWDQVKLHQDLAKDIEEKFGSVPQQDTGPRSLNLRSQLPPKLLRPTRWCRMS